MLANLETFLTLASTKNTVETATKHNISRTAVYSRIKLLEQFFGHELLERSKKQKILNFTPAGNYVAQKGEFAAQNFYALRYELNSFANPQAGTLRLGTTKVIEEVFLADFLRRFTLTYPAIQLKLSTGTEAELSRQVRSEGLDLALLEGPFEQGDLKSRGFYTDTLKLVQPYEWTRDKKHLQTKAVKWIVPASGHYRAIWEDYLANYLGQQPAQVLEFTGPSAMLDAVRHELGFALLSEKQALSAQVNKEAYMVKAAKSPTVRFNYLHKIYTPAIRAMLGMLKTEFGK